MRAIPRSALSSPLPLLLPMAAASVIVLGGCGSAGDLPAAGITSTGAIHALGGPLRLTVLDVGQGDALVTGSRPAIPKARNPITPGA